MSKHKVSILVVDDEPDICANLSDIFTDLGFHVDVAYDGPSALELVRSHPYEIALLDLKMPGMDGLELYRRIKELRVGTMAAIVTAYASDAVVRAAIEAGAMQVLPKPVDPRQLLSVVETVIDRPLILIVDDDVDLCDALVDVFNERGYRAFVARSVAEAAQRLDVSQLRVAIVDLRLPEGDGKQVLQNIRQRHPRAATVVITGHRFEMQHLLDEVRAEGVDAICFKPFDVGVLLGTVDKLAREDE